METFTVRVDLTRKDFVRLYLIKSAIHPTMLVPVFLLLTLSLVTVINAKEDINVANTYAFWAALVYAPILLLYRGYSFNKIFKTNPILQYGITYNFNDDGITGITNGVNIYVEWKRITKRFERQNHLTLYTANNSVYIIPINLLTKEQLQAIRRKTAKKK